MSQSTVAAIVLLGLVGSAQLISADPVQFSSQPGSPSQMNTNSNMNYENNRLINPYGQSIDGTNNPMMQQQQQQPGNLLGNFQNGMAVPSQQRQGANFYSGFPGGMNNMASMNPMGLMQQQQLPQQQMQQMQQQMQQSSMPSMQGAMNNNGMDLGQLIRELLRNAPQAVQSLLARLSGNQQMPLDPSQAQRLFQNPNQMGMGMGMGYGQFPNNFQQPMRQGGMMDLSNLLRPVSNALGQNPLTAPIASTLDNVSGGLQRTLSNTLSPQQGQQPLSMPQSPPLQGQHGLQMPQSPQSQQQQSPSASGSGSSPGSGSGSNVNRAK